MSGLTINKAQRRLVLAAFDRRGELQYENNLLHLSLRGSTPGSKEHQLERLTLAVSRLDVPEILGQKKIRTLCSQDIRGIDGPITQIQNLRPIFLLSLPATQTLPNRSECSNSDPVQFMFRCFGGSSFGLVARRLLMFC